MFKDIFEKYKDFLNNSKRQRYYTEQNYSWNHMEKLVNQILDDNIPEFPKKMELKLPELNIPKL